MIFVTSSMARQMTLIEAGQRDFQVAGMRMRVAPLLCREAGVSTFNVGSTHWLVLGVRVAMAVAVAFVRR